MRSICVMKYHSVNNPMFRPPAEADSLILQVDQGCPHNCCTFCGMYSGVRYYSLSLEEVGGIIASEGRRYSGVQRIFLADGDVMRRSFEELRAILEMLNERFPRLARVGVYANGSSIGEKSDEELRDLRGLKLHTLYMGLESGDEGVLKRCGKGERVEQMVSAGVKAQECGLRMSVMVLLGLGGVERTSEHALHTAEAVNKMQPRLLSALRVVPIEGTRLYEDVEEGRFCQLTERQVVEELRSIVSGLELKSTVFRANHSSNVVPLEGRLPKDRERLLAEMDGLLRSGRLDEGSPGVVSQWL